MATKIRAAISRRNRYWIDKHRHYELKHFCLQYPLWKRTYAAIDELSSSAPILGGAYSSNTPGDPTAKCVIKKAYYLERIHLVEDAAREADEDLYLYILKAVTEDLSYTYLQSKLQIPCSRDTYYDRYRRFFWLLNKSRE